MQERKISDFFAKVSLVLFLTLISVLIYFDRGAISSVLPKIKEHFNLSGTEEGAIASAFMVGYMIFSVLFAELSSKIRPSFVLCFGLLMWACAAIIVGITPFLTEEKWGYYLLVSCRTLVGIGESAYLPIAPTLLDDITPAKYRTIVFSFYFATLPIGIALGYGIAGALALFSWSVPFWAEGALMIVLALLCLLIKSPTNMKKNPKAFLALKAASESDTDESDKDTQQMMVSSPHERPSEQEIIHVEEKTRTVKSVSFFYAVRELICNDVYIFSVLGTTAYTFVLGAMSFWGPSFIRANFNLDIAIASLGFSVCSLFTGIFGTMTGGILLDRIGGSSGKRGTSKALFLSFLFVLIGFPFGLVALFMTNVIAFFVLLTAAEFCLFAITTTTNVVILNCVPKELRTYAMSLYIFVMHFGGDFPSPFFFGIIADITSSLLTAMIILWLVLIACFSMYFIGWRRAKGKLKKRMIKKERGYYEKKTLAET